MADTVTMISELLHEAAETHHRVFRITDGTDADWATWYSDWLLNLSELPGTLGSQPPRSALTFLLVRLDREFNRDRPDERWEDYYARALVRELSSA